MKHTILILLAMILGIFIPKSYAVEIAPQSCDSNYWRQLSSRAWLEAEREIMQNQNLIFKPDSVIEYTCFDRAVNVNAHAGGDIFVHTEYFGDKIIQRQGEYSMEQALANVVHNSLLDFSIGAFNHSFLGGRSEDLGAGVTTYKYQSPMEKLSRYECQIMSKVWKASMCANFIDNKKFENNDGFYPFERLKKYGASEDVAGYADTIVEARQYPGGEFKCEGVNQSGQEKYGWTDNLIRSDNRNQDLYDFQTPLYLIFDEVNERTEPGKCSGKGKQAIKTGVTVITDDGTHDDGICTNPGCSFQEDGTCS